MTAEPTRILLVEDNLGDARLLREVLAEAGTTQFELAQVERLSEALKNLREERFEVILLDLSLPDEQGLNTVVRVYNQAPSVPIVVLTGLDDEALAVKAVQHGAQDYLVKGQVDGNLLVRAIRYAIERKRAEVQIQRQLQQMTALREIDLAITSTLDLRQVLDVLIDKIDILLPYSAATLRLFNKKSGLLEPIACRNLDEEEWKADQWRGGGGIHNVVFQNKAPWMVSNVQTDPSVPDHEFFRKHGLVSYLEVPLVAKGEILGVLSFYTKEEHQFSNEEVEFLSTFAGQAAIAIHNAQLYEQTKKQAVELEAANKVKDEFLSVMSHELRTPLNIVIGYTGMIKERMFGEINPEQEKVLGKVLMQSKDLLSMISAILDVTRIEAQVAKAESHEVSVRYFLDELRSACDLPLNKELTLNWDYSSDLPVIKTDSEKLRHILQNLIDNAIKFTKKGNVTISARHFLEANRMEFRVEDTGIGIPKEALPIIFEKFRQMDSSVTRSYGGMGLGLYIVKMFTEMLEGKVEVKSEPGKGSTFTVTLPLSYKDSDSFSRCRGISRQTHDPQTGFSRLGSKSEANRK